MANVIHRTTLEYRRSASESDHPEPAWKHNPDMSAVAAVPPRYWKAPPDWDAPSAGPLEMTQAEKDAADAAILETSKDNELAPLQAGDYPDLLRALALVLMDEINLIRAEIETRHSQASLPQRTPAQLIAALRAKMG